MARFVTIIYRRFTIVPQVALQYRAVFVHERNSVLVLLGGIGGSISGITRYGYDFLIPTGERVGVFVICVFGRFVTIIYRCLAIIPQVAFQYRAILVLESDGVLVAFKFGSEGHIFRNDYGVRVLFTTI